ncbi:MAG: hypothetical protein ABJA62_10310 [Luteimonas sp.]
MDFLKILKSFEEFVYEALSWFVLLPKTLTRIVIRPGKMSDYVAAELHKSEAARYNDAISPPLLLILCVLFAHFLDLAIRTQSTDISGSLASTLVASDQNLLLYRTLAFGLWALAGAVYIVLRSGLSLSRDSLRVPFYQQCYLVSPFALALSVGLSLLLTRGYGIVVGACLIVLGFLWFWIGQTVWINRATKLPKRRSAIAAISIVLVGSVANGLLVYGLLTTHAPPDPPAVHAR